MKDVKFVWTPDIDKEFEECKKLLTGELVVHPFQTGLETELVTDASRVGLGFMLLQKKDGKRRLIQAGSCALTPAQRNYSARKRGKHCQC